MAIYRFAILSGSDARLPARIVHHYQLIACPTYRHALNHAESLNAVICGWRAA